MLRGLVGIIVGYIVMTILVTVLYLGGFLALGVERFFKSDSYEVSILWLVLSTLISVGVAILGGYICAVLSRSVRACQILALIVLSLGVVLYLPKMHKEFHVRAGDVPTLQVMQLAQMPAWMHVLAPVLAAMGVLWGARMKKSVNQ